MKKLIISALCIAAAFTGVLAQTNETELRQQLDEANARLAEINKDDFNKKIWGKGKYLHIGYDWQQTAVEGEGIEKSNFAISLTKGTSYLFPTKPIANLLKVGVDVQWFDLGFAKYKNETSHDENWDSMGSIWDNIGGDEEGGFDLGFMDSFSKLGRMTFTAGMGIGPVVTVAPFANFGNQASYLKASVYFHWKPTFGMYLLSEDGDLSASYGYCNLFDFGGKITWKAIGLGIEGRWGNGKFNPVSLDFDFGEGNYEDIYGSEVTQKIRRNFASTRLYLYLCF